MCRFYDACYVHLKNALNAVLVHLSREAKHGPWKQCLRKVEGGGPQDRVWALLCASLKEAGGAEGTQILPL